MAEKRTAEDTLPLGPYAKKKKDRKGEEPVLAPGVNLKSLRAHQLDLSIENVTRKERLCAEAFSFWPVPHDKYLESQAQYVMALFPRKDELVQYRTSNVANKPWRIRSRTVATFFFHLMSQDGLKDNKELADAIQYRLAYWVSYVFEDHPNRIGTEWELVIGKDDPVRFYRSVIEGAVRHVNSLKQPAEDDSTSAPAQPTPSTAAPPPAPTAPTPPEPAINPLSDARFQLRLADYIVDVAQLKDVVPWEDLIIDSKFKSRVERHVKALKVGEQMTPSGVLLHGPQGTGKTAVAYSLCRRFGATLISVSGSAKGSLQGQSEKLLEFIFREARQLAESGLTVLFFDEADGFFGSNDRNPSAHALELMANIKAYWGGLISANVPCFVIGATNSPWNIAMSDFGRRFDDKIHIPLPAPLMRKAIFEKLLAKTWHQMDDSGLEQLVEMTQGFSTYDLKKLVDMVKFEKSADMADATDWIYVQTENGQVLCPANPNDGPVDFQGTSLDELRENSAEVQLSPAPVLLEDVLKMLGEVKPANPQGADDAHIRWQVSLRQAS